jgi:putative hydrolase of the HAD superfamily
MVKALIFDFGGVLMRTQTPTGRAEWEVRLDLAPGELERIVHGSTSWIKAQRGQISVDDHWAYVAETCNARPEAIPQMRKDYFRDDVLDTDLVALIREMRAKGYKTGLLSNDVADLEARLREVYKIHDAFDAVVISAQIGVMKPDSGAYKAISRALDVAPQDCVFIDDAPRNIEGAEALGIKGILFTPNVDLREAFKELGIS